MNSALLKPEERAILRLRDLYRTYGYTCFKMSKFEAYELYVENKEFLISDRVITFTDTDGKLMALKPDVTLSIVKNAPEGGGVSRVYYNESVFRVSERTHQFKELLDIAQRLQVARMLDEKCSYAVITKETGMSTATISRVNRCLMYGSGGYRMAIDGMKKEPKA